MHSTSTIKIENNDCKIWHRDQIIIDFMQAIHKNNDIVINLNSEGPCATALGLYQLINKLCDQTGYDPGRIIIKTCNLIEHSNQCRVVIIPPVKHISDLQKMLTDGQVPLKKISADIKHFGHFIGHSSRSRLAIASWLYKNHQAKTLQTFHTTPSNELHKEFIGLEDQWLNNYQEQYIDNSIEFLKLTPLTYDSVGPGPILHMKMYGILGALSNIFVDIVCNTYVTGNTFYMDEKLWRPIITRTPFIVHGPRNFIINLKKLGFQTFDQWWDEGFSEDPPDVQVVEIIKIIDEIAQWDLNRINTVYDQMKSVLDHNYNRFMELNNEEFKRIFLS
jgi:hypothetical protein